MLQIELFHGLIAGSYHIFIRDGNKTVIVTIDVIMCNLLSSTFQLPITDY